MGTLIIFLIFIYKLKIKVKRLKMALTLDERVETLHFAEFLKAQVYAVKSEIFVLLCYCRFQYVEQNPHKHGKAAEKMCRVSRRTYRA
jgi:hypothetical protein